ncbi:MAG: FG-GAP-like repeat-containing protein [Nitrospinales bacterium]
MKNFKFIRLLLILLFISISALFAQQGLNIINTLDLGPPPSGLNISRAGAKISVLGDINGDGYDDWATIAGVEYETGTGYSSVHIYLGSPVRRESETKADIIFYGNEDMRPSGGVWKAGDVNADGYDDFIVYGFWLDENINELVPTHALYYGGDPFDTEVDVLFRKMDIHGGTANFSSDAGDVNNDGFDDILLSVPTPISGFDTAHVYLFYGAENMDNNPDIIFSSTVEITLNGPVALNFTGATAAGDMNNDDYDDIIIKAHSSAKVYFGGADMDNVEDVVIDDFYGAGTGTGPNVADAGDVNNDGYDDILMTANIANSKAFICYGGQEVDSIPDVIIPMWTEGSNPAFSTAAAGDLNNDGFDDILLGTSTLWSLEHAQVRVFWGGTQMDSLADVVLDTPQPWHIFGYGIAGNGDFDGDGYPDFLVGNIGNAATLDRHDEAGNISIFYGGETISDSADAVFSGSADNEGFGSSVAYADVNNDGFQDIIVGAVSHWEGPYHYAGRAYLFYGGESWDTEPDLTFNTTFVYNGYHGHFGKKVRSLGDINGDGFEDIFIEEIFKVLLYLGGAPMDSVHDYFFNVPQYNYSFSAVGDVNQDGYDDVLYSNPATGSGGSAYLYLGGSNLMDGVDVTFTGVNTEDRLGFRTSAAGDLNGDGYDDFIISVPGDDSTGNNAGAVYVFFGDTAISTTPDLVLYGHYDEQSFGSRNITAGGDINNDGFDDIIIGDSFFSYSELSYEGRLYIYYGGNSMDNEVDNIITGSSSLTYLSNRTIQIIPDINNDGFDEIYTSQGNYQSGGDDGEKPVIFYGGMPTDSLSDVTLPFSSMNMDLGTYINDNENSVYLMIGDPTDIAAGPQMGRVSIYSNSIISDIGNIRFLEKPNGYQLYQNYPNPFNPKTLIKFSIPKTGHVTLDVYNSLGQKVITLLDKQTPAGNHEVEWDASNMASGVYYYKLSAGDFEDVKKMVLIK